MALKYQHFVFNIAQENSYILWDDDTKLAVIIDPGNMNSGENKILDDFIASNNLKISQVWNTHCHLDHIYGNRYVCEKYKVDLLTHELELQNIISADVYGPSKFGLPAPNSNHPDRYITNGETLKVGGITCKVLFVPGHSPGHIAFYFEAESIIFSGDVLFENSVGRTDLPGGSFPVLEQSIKEVMYKLPDHTVVLSGHGNKTTIVNEKKNNPFVRL